MGKLVVVQNDKVEGTDKHNVAGNATNPAAPPPTVPYVGVADFDYVGKITDQLSDFVNVDGAPVATVGSKSTLDPGESSPAGRHGGPAGKKFLPPTPTPIATTLSITDPVGDGHPSSTAGSTFVKVGGTKVLLDGDRVDTCDGKGIKMNSTVTAQGQSFVSCSA